YRIVLLTPWYLATISMFSFVASYYRVWIMMSSEKIQDNSLLNVLFTIQIPFAASCPGRNLSFRSFSVTAAGCCIAKGLLNKDLILVYFHSSCFTPGIPIF